MAGENAWLSDKISRVEETREADIALDATMMCGEDAVSVNVTCLPLTGTEGDALDSTLLLEDISSEKSMKSTMSRYMGPGLAEKLMSGGGDLPGGQDSVAAILFSDYAGQAYRRRSYGSLWHTVSP